MGMVQTSSVAAADAMVNGANRRKEGGEIMTRKAAKENDAGKNGPEKGQAGTIEPLNGTVTAQDEEKKLEDEILVKGEEIGSRRALIAQAFKPPCPEPSRSYTHRDHMLEEMKWLAVDMAQERLWKQSVAIAIAVEIATMEGDFGLKQPPHEYRKYSDEIAELKRNVAKSISQPSGRRTKAAAKVSPAAMLQIDLDSDPAVVDVREGTSEMEVAVPDNVGEILLTYEWNAEASAKKEDELKEVEKNRIIEEETAYRSYRLEYEAALASHQLAVAEQQAAANAIDEYEIGHSLDLDILDDGLLGPPRKMAKRQRGARGTYGGIDEYEDDRRVPGKLYRHGDYEAAYTTETGRYQKRHGAQNRNRRANDRARNTRTAGRIDPYQQTTRIQGQPGILSWNKVEDDLLLAVVHEFGLNWTLVSEVLSKSLLMHGIHRPAQQCRQRFRQIMVGYSKHDALLLAMNCYF